MFAAQNLEMRATESLASVQLSRSLSSGTSHDARNKIVRGDYSVIDKIFPVFDEMLKQGEVPSILEHITMFIVMLQIFSFSLWPAFTFLTLTNSWDDTLCLWIFRITFLSKISKEKSSMVAQLALYSVLIFILIFSLAIQLIIYYRTRRFFKGALSFSRTVFDIIPLLCIFPCSLWLGGLLKYAIKTHQTFYVVNTVISVIYFSILILFYHLQSNFSATLPYIPSSHLTCWNGTTHFFMVVPQSIFLIISYIVDFFPKYFMILLIVIATMFNVLMVARLFYLPFTHIQMNAIFAGVYAAINIPNVLKLLFIYDIKIRYWIVLVSSIVCMLIFTITSKLIFNSRIKKMCKNMTYDVLDEIPDTEIGVPYNRVDSHLVVLKDEKTRIHYHNLGLDRSASRCMLYMRCGLANRSPLFLNWSVAKFAGEFHKTSEIITTIVQMISFFPCESRLLSSFFNIACNFDLSLSQRFLLYQINNIKALRQSSASSDIAENIMHLNNKGNTVIDDVKKFWITCPDELDVFYEIQKNTKQIKELYLEAMEKWPNNVRICENYSKFLIEGAMDFKEGVKIKHRAELIEQGKNFALDKSFRSLVRAYPEYLKKNVMNVHGQFIQENTDPDKTSASSSSGSRGKGTDMSTGTIDGVLDPEIEESLARNCFTYHRLRLEFQNCIQNRKLKYQNHLFFAVLWNLILVAAICIFYYAFYQSRFDRRYDSISRVINVNTVKYSFDSGFLTSVYVKLHELGTLKDDFWNQISVIKGTPYEIDLDRGAKEISRFLDAATNNLTIFMNDLMEMAQQNLDIEAYKEIIANVVPTHACVVNRMMNGTYDSSLKDIYIRLISSMREMHSEEDNIPQDQDSRPCQIISNAHEQGVAFLNMATRILGLIHNLELEDNKVNLIIMISVPLIYAVLGVPIIYIYLFLCFKELKYVYTILRNLNQQVRELASKSLTRSEEDETIVKESMRSHNINVCVLYSIAALPIISAVLFVTVPLICQSRNKDFKEYNYWTYYSITRSYNSIQSVVFSTLALSMHQGKFPNMSYGMEFLLYMAKRFLAAVNRDNNNLLRGSTNARGCVGVSTLLDQYNIKEDCVEDGFVSGDHKDYKCLSLDGAVTKLYSYLSLALKEPYNASMGPDSELANAFHLVNSHIVEKAWRSTREIFTLARDSIKNFRITIAIVCWMVFMVAFIISIVMWVFFNQLYIAYKGVIQLMMRVPPLGLSSSQQLMNYITHKEGTKKNEAMAPSKSVVYLSKDSVIFFNKNMNIEWINSATTSIFGYTPDQLLGQPLHTVLTESLNEELYKQIEMMKNAQCALTYEKSFVGLTDDEQTMPVHCTLIGMADNGSSTPKAFVIIMRDERDLVAQRKDAENAKAQSEKLLYQILPRDIVTRLNSGETDINFTVPSATIIFIDIVKFSNYAATLTPAQIMDHLSIIFAKFDAIVAKYNYITKIKLIGDVYMAAAGLFNPDVSPEKHAAQVINFGLESITALDDANNLFNSNLMTRIGVNTNGPLIAGVLGTDKPVFDIIGDPINVASRLQSTAIPGTVQISEETYQLIVNMNYNIERRGEIELKGKGKKMAYVVRPLALSSFFSVLPEIVEPPQVPNNIQILE